jgi:hypothetical protein
MSDVVLVITNLTENKLGEVPAVIASALCIHPTPACLLSPSLFLANSFLLTTDEC